MRNQVKKNSSKGNNSTQTATLAAQRERATQHLELLNLPVNEIISYALNEKDLKNEAYEFLAQLGLLKQFYNSKN